MSNLRILLSEGEHPPARPHLLQLSPAARLRAEEKRDPRVKKILEASDKLEMRVAASFQTASWVADAPHYVGSFDPARDWNCGADACVVSAQVVARAASSALLAEVRLLPHPRSSRCDSPPPPPNPHRLPCLSRALEPHGSRGARLLPQLARSVASPRRTYAAPPACSGGTGKRKGESATRMVSARRPATALAVGRDARAPAHAHVPARCTHVLRCLPLRRAGAHADRNRECERRAVVTRDCETERHSVVLLFISARRG